MKKFSTLYKFLKSSGFKVESSRLRRIIVNAAPEHSDSYWDIDPEEHENIYLDPDDDFYPDLSDELIESEREKRNIFFGRNINWVGTRGEMVNVPVDNMYPISGNSFSNEKMKSLQNKIENAEERIYLYPPVVSITIVSVQDVLESRQDGFYDHAELTTDDEELDEYLKDKEEWAALNLKNMGSDNYSRYYQSYEDWVGVSELDEIDLDEDQIAELEEFKEFESDFLLIAAIEAKEIQADKEGWGDIGDVIYQVRDGNHRAFAAKNTGEDSIWCFVEEGQLERIRSGNSQLSDIEVY